VNRASEVAASLRRPTLINQRCDSGSTNVPTAKTNPHANWRAMGIKYAEASGRVCVHLVTVAARSRPMVIAH
jgi:hypothetical protein